MKVVILGKNVLKLNGLDDLRGGMKMVTGMFKDWGKGTEPPEWTTKVEVREMIDDAIRKHNRNASIISFCVDWVVLALFSRSSRLIG